MKEIEEDLAHVNSHIAFKEKRLNQVESSKDYKLCDRITEEIIECKTHKRELEKEQKLLNQKDKKAKKRLKALQIKLIRSTIHFKCMQQFDHFYLTSFYSVTSFYGVFR